VLKAGKTVLKAGLAALVLAGCAACLPTAAVRPPEVSTTMEPPISAPHPPSFVEAIRPARAGRPVIAVLALNEGTETTDLLLPHAVLKRADIAEVQLVAPRAGPIRLFPALEIDGGLAFSAFDRLHPSGADIVIVPAMAPDDDPAVTAWLQRQAKLGAKVIGICSGARVLGHAGLLDGRSFTGHWHDRSTLLKRHTGARHVPDQRYLIDRGAGTSTGVTASLPTVLAVVEAMAGAQKARTLADELGVASWGPEHDSARFGLTPGRALTYLFHSATTWHKENWQVAVHDEMDDVALALVVDAWARTGRMRVEATSASAWATLRSGLRLRTHPATTSPRVPLQAALKPVQQLDRTLCQIAERYGAARRDWVMLEMEYPGPAGENCKKPSP
jgi:transcriptional regulator GlxA family with amidase domain